MAQTPDRNKFILIKLIVVLFNVIAAVMRRFAIVAGSYCNLRQIAAAVFAIVILARFDVAHNGLLVFHIQSS